MTVININGNGSVETPKPPSDLATGSERHAARWQLQAITALVTVPVVAATVATGYFTTSLAVELGSTVSDKALLAGLALIPVVLTAGLPLVEFLTRDEDAGGARHANYLWSMCAGLTIAASVAYGVRGPVPLHMPSTAQIEAPQAASSLQGQLDRIGPHLSPYAANEQILAYQRKHQALMRRTVECDHVETEADAIACGDFQALVEALNTAKIAKAIEGEIMDAGDAATGNHDNGNVFPTAEARQAGTWGGGALRLVVALLCSLGSALGIRPTAAAVRVLLTGRTSKPVSLGAAVPDEEPANGQEELFRHWVRSKLTIGDGGEITCKEAYESYKFYAGCNLGIPLPPTPFGRRLTQLIEARGGSTRKSGSTIYSNVKFFERAPEPSYSE